MARYVTSKGLSRSAVTQKELALLSTHIRKATDILGTCIMLVLGFCPERGVKAIIGKDPNVFAASRFFRHETARLFWTTKCASDVRCLACQMRRLL